MSSSVPSNTEAHDICKDLVATVEGPGDLSATDPTCPICMEPWTCNDAHRICCIPCWHVYGRSCLERWLQRSGHDSAKCPQCGKKFEHELITNLYAPGNLWDGCCRLQDIQAEHQFELDTKTEEFRSFLISINTSWEDAFSRMEKRVKEERETTNAHLMLAKEHMKKLLEGGKVSHADLQKTVESIEKNCPTMSPVYNPHAHAEINVENRRQHHAESSRLADAVKRLRQQTCTPELIEPNDNMVALLPPTQTQTQSIAELDRRFTESPPVRRRRRCVGHD